MQTNRLLISLMVLAFAVLSVSAFLDSPNPALAQSVDSSFNGTNGISAVAVMTTTTPLPTNTPTMGATNTATATVENPATPTATATGQAPATATPTVTMESTMTPTATGTPSSRDLYLALIYKAELPPTPTPTFTPTLTPTPDPECNAYFDTFSDPNSGWGSRDVAVYRRGYVDNEYQLYHKEGGYIVFVASPAPAFSNYTVEADFRWQDSPGFSYGLIFGINESSDFYLFEVGQDLGAYAISFWPANGNPQLVTNGGSDAILPGNAVNHLEIRTNGGQQEYYINDTYVTSTNINDSGARYTGISSSTEDSSSSNRDSRFDNFCITTPAGSNAAGETPAKPPVLELRQAPSYLSRMQ